MQPTSRREPHTKPLLLPFAISACDACGAGTLQLVEERTGDGTAINASGEEVDRDGATLRLKAGGAFYAPAPLQSVAVHWPMLVAGAPSGEVYHLEVES